MHHALKQFATDKRECRVRELIPHTGLIPKVTPIFKSLPASETPGWPRDCHFCDTRFTHRDLDEFLSSMKTSMEHAWSPYWQTSWIPCQKIT